ncbi:MAG: ABC transporter permease [Candidatus Bathyarchaeia archaeon]
MKNFKKLLGILPIAALILAWEIAAQLNLTPGHFFLPSFSAVMRTLFDMIISGVLVNNLLRSLFRVLIGLFAGAFFGLTAGIVMGCSKVMDDLLHPIVSILYPVPAVGWLPLLMLWMGIGEMLPITIIFICSFFPTAYTTATGIKNVDKKFIKAAETLGASPMTILKTVVLPLALPTIFTGLRLEAGMAWRVIIAAEMVAIPTGLGALFMQAESLIRIDIILACLIVLSVMCFIFERFFQYFESKICKWARRLDEG